MRVLASLPVNRGPGINWLRGRGKVPTDGEPTGWLADRRETSGRGTATISTGVDDPGGPSVGRSQMTPRTWAGFLGSEFGAPWRDELRGLRPGTSEFRNAWNRLVQREGTSVESAQYKYLHGVNYTPMVRDLLRSTGFNLYHTDPIIREVAWSASNNLGPDQSEEVFRSAMHRSDQQLGREHPNYVPLLIRQVYQGWIRHVGQLAAARADPGEARTFRNMATSTLPREMNDALQAFHRQRRGRSSPR